MPAVATASRCLATTVLLCVFCDELVRCSVFFFAQHVFDCSWHIVDLRGVEPRSSEMSVKGLRVYLRFESVADWELRSHSASTIL